MAEIQCFWAEPTARAATSFRRYANHTQYVDRVEGCPGGYSYHNAIVSAEEIDLPLCNANGTRDYDGWGRDDVAHDDPRWPIKCDACDYVFKPDDHWQHNAERIYEGGGQRFDVRHAPVGAMWDTGGGWSPPGPDGIALMVMLPGSVPWSPDAPCVGDPAVPWNRTGVIPNVTCNPSVNIKGGWHGWVRDGKLVDA